VAASTAILSHYLDSRLPSVVKPAELSALWKIAEGILTFPSEFQIHVLEVYTMAYGSQITLAVAFSVAQLDAVAIIWERQNVRYAKD
jgi:hypothetical protein